MPCETFIQLPILTMPYLSHPRKTLIVFAIIFLTTNGIVNAQELADSPAKIFASLAAEIQRVGKTTANFSEYKIVESKARMDLKTLIERDPNSGTLVEMNPAGATPLMVAAAYGFSSLVEELLKSERVKASINSVGANQTTAWMFSNFLFRESLWSCRPQILNDPFTWVPLFESQRFYKYFGDEKPYVLTRNVLEKSGATVDLVGAKAAWLERCPNSDDAIKAQIKDSKDLLVTLQEDGRFKLAMHQIKLRKEALIKAPHLPIKRTPSLEDVELPVDFQIVSPAGELGLMASQLTGWWSSSSIFFGETLYAFEKFASEREVIVVYVPRFGKTKPYKGRRLTMTIDGNALVSKINADTKISLNFSAEGHLSGVIENPKLTLPLILRRYQPD